jgi:hypothetical protein
VSCYPSDPENTCVSERSRPFELAEIVDRAFGGDAEGAGQGGQVDRRVVDGDAAADDGLGASAFLGDDALVELVVAVGAIGVDDYGQGDALVGRVQSPFGV